MQQTAGTNALQYLVPSREAVNSSSIKKWVKKAVYKAIEESQEAGRVLDRIVAIIYEISVITIQMYFYSLQIFPQMFHSLMLCQAFKLAIN